MVIVAHMYPDHMIGAAISPYLSWGMWLLGMASITTAVVTVLGLLLVSMGSSGSVYPPDTR